MALTLLVENNPQITEVYLINLEVYAGLDILVAKDISGAIELLEEHPFELVIARSKIGSSEVAATITAHLQEKKKNVPLLMVGAGSKPAGATTAVPGSLNLKAVVKGAAQALGITAQDMMKRKVEDYFPVEEKVLKRITAPCCKIYARNQAGDFHEVCPPNLPWTRTGAQPPFYYVNKLDRLKMIDQITAELLSCLEEKDLNPDEQLQATASNMELLTQKLKTLGLADETLGLAKKTMDSLANQAKKHPKLSVLMKRLLTNETSYLFRHTQVVTYVGLHIIRNIDWGTPEQEAKVSFISFFHDIYLENDEEAKIHSKAELREASGLNESSKQLVDKHAQLAAELITKYPHAPMGADQIVRQHHGVLNGVGFSDHYGANLSPMSLVFLVAEEFTRIIINQGEGPFHKDEMISELKAEFISPRFSKIIEIVEKLSL